MAAVNEFHKKIEISLGAIVWWTTLLITTTFSASTIYWNFNAMQHEAEIFSERADKRHKRTTEDISDHEDRLRRLEQMYIKIQEMDKEIIELKKKGSDISEENSNSK